MANQKEELEKIRPPAQRKVRPQRIMELVWTSPKPLMVEAAIRNACSMR